MKGRGNPIADLIVLPTAILAFGSWLAAGAAMAIAVFAIAYRQPLTAAAQGMGARRAPATGPLRAGSRTGYQLDLPWLRSTGGDRGHAHPLDALPGREDADEGHGSRQRRCRAVLGGHRCQEGRRRSRALRRHRELGGSDDAPGRDRTHRTGGHDLDREQVDRRLQEIIDAKTSDWGITVQWVEIRDVRLPGMLEDAMSRKAQADRESEARVILAHSELAVAEEMEKASAVYFRNPVALRMRAMNMTYESIKERGALMVVPSDMVSSMGGLAAFAPAAFDAAVPRVTSAASDEADA